MTNVGKLTSDEGKAQTWREVKAPGDQGFFILEVFPTTQVTQQISTRNQVLTRKSSTGNQVLTAAPNQLILEGWYLY